MAVTHALTIGGTFVGTIMTLVFLPAMYSIWFKIRPANKGAAETPKQVALEPRGEDAPVF
jgi:hypothetical protein